MKYAVLVGKGIANKNTSDGYKNIGDYIQNLAAIQFLPRVDEYIDRETLDKGTEHVKMIMNGWFIGNINSFPCYERVDPLPISMHIVPDIFEKLLSQKKVFEWFKNNEPIGCRDKETLSLLNKKGITGYFSNCLTLTLGKKYNNIGYKKNIDNLIFVDPYLNKHIDFSNIEKKSFLQLFIKHPFTVFILLRKFTGKTNVYCYWEMPLKAKIFNILQFISIYSQCFSLKQLRTATYLSHIVLVGNKTRLKSEEDKLLYADYLLKQYEKADLVVTSRIHCSLPCLAMNTPILFSTGKYLHEKATSEDEGRLGGVEELFNTIQIEKNIITNKINFPVINKDTYRKFSKDLIDRCESFIKEE